MCREEPFIDKQPFMLVILIVKLSYEWANKLDLVSHVMITRKRYFKEINFGFGHKKTDRQIWAF